MPYCLSYLCEDDGYIVAWDGNLEHEPLIWEFVDFADMAEHSNVHRPLWEAWNHDGNEDTCIMFDTLPPEYEDYRSFSPGFPKKPEPVQEGDSVYWKLWLNFDQEEPVCTTTMDLIFWRERDAELYEVDIEVIRKVTYKVLVPSPEFALYSAKAYADREFEGRTTPSETWEIRLSSPS